MDRKGDLILWLKGFVQQEHVSQRKIIWSILAVEFKRSLGTKISNLCRKCGKKVVLMIDEVDKSSGNDTRI